jgi:hypothetical protein
MHQKHQLMSQTELRNSPTPRHHFNDFAGRAILANQIYDRDDNGSYQTAGCKQSKDEEHPESRTSFSRHHQTPQFPALLNSTHQSL